jgi:mannose-6-phosphate isomerase-like protein (cupin superfamily)
MWRVINSRDMAFEPYSKGIAEIKRVMRQGGGEGRFEGFGFLRVPPNGVFPRHSHPEREEIYYVVSGTGTLMVGDEEATVSVGSVVYISGDVSHGLSNLTDVPLVVIYVTAFA